MHVTRDFQFEMQNNSDREILPSLRIQYSEYSFDEVHFLY